MGAPGARFPKKGLFLEKIRNSLRQSVHQGSEGKRLPIFDVFNLFGPLMPPNQVILETFLYYLGVPDPSRRVPPLPGPQK